ncbi:hypothetical protein DC74_3555 [Streptomyces noursei]|nr:hypothetical protein DC74_3555 [Streptomyces noursei]
MLDPGEFGFGAGREAVLPARVVGEFVVAPVAFVERRVEQDGVGGELREGVGAQGVGGPDADRGAGRLQGEPERGEGGEVGVGLLPVEGGRRGVRGPAGDRRGVPGGAPGGVLAGGGQESADAAGRVQDGGRRAVAVREFGHQGGRPGRGQGVLAGVGVQVAAEQEGVGRGGPVGGGEVAGGADEIGGAGEGRAGQAAHRVLGAQPGGQHGLQQRGQHAGEFGVVGGAAELPPGGGAFVDEQEDGADLAERGGGAGGVADELLPDPFAGRDLGDLALVAEPLLDVVEGEGGAGLGAADGLGEVGVAAAPVADRGPADAGEPGDAGGGHLGRAAVRPAPRAGVRSAAVRAVVRRLLRHLCGSRPDDPVTSACPLCRRAYPCTTNEPFHAVNNDVS